MLSSKKTAVLSCALILCSVVLIGGASAWAQNTPSPPIRITKKPVTPKFQLPLSCKLGKDCWIMNYTDTGTDGDGAGIDPFCNARSYEGHKGTDFAIPDETAMKKALMFWPRTRAPSHAFVIARPIYGPQKKTSIKSAPQTKTAVMPCSSTMVTVGKPCPAI